MARKSRKNVNEVLPITSEDNNTFPTAIYVRLSIENSGKKDEGNSIENQTSICEEYLAEQPDLKLYKIYSDNGEKGTDFDRPGFSTMMKDARQGKVKCIIVKDLSRFGRDYIETGNYLEKIFPFLGIRFISVTDNYDSALTEDVEGALLIPLKNMINEMYAKDISHKIITSFRARQENAEVLPAFAPYGYVKSKTRKYRYEIDEAVADNVRLIYELKAEGVPKEEQIIVEGMHEAIISKETFLQAQKILKTGYKKKTEGYCDYPLKGKVRCGCCKRAMTHRFKKVRRKDYAYFRCVYSMYQNGANCCKHYTKESVVNETILQSIKRMLELSDKVAEGLKLKKEESKTNATELIKQIAALQQKLEKCNSEKFANIDDFMAGNLKKELYQKRRSELTELAGQLESSITKKEQELQDVQLGKNKELEIELQKIGGYADVNELDKRMVQDFIDVVYVYDPEHVEIVWKFSDELKKILLDYM